MKWVVSNPNTEGTPLGRKCQRCSGSSVHHCSCDNSNTCTVDSCKCAKEGKCCKCCCKENCKAGCAGEKAKCICVEEEKSYRSAYRGRYSSYSYIEGRITAYQESRWNKLRFSLNRHHCAQILLGSVCLIWSGVTYMHWTGKYAKGSPYWNNHILDGSGLDDGTLSQWLQALGFPRDMLNNSGPQNRLDQVIWDGFMGKLFLGFTHPTGVSGQDGITAKQPYDMNYAGFVHTAHRDSFNTEARVFPKLNGSGSSTTGEISETDQNKMGAIFKLYILSCAYFTGLQKKSAALSTTKNTTPRTIREILYWLSALPYSQAYKEMLHYAKEKLKEVLKKPGETESSSAKETELKFHQTGRTHPITVHEYNLFAHFQAVTQYCPLVLIGIQGGLKGTDKTLEPPIHSLYANTECNFTYPTVPIQAYNQVVHYIRALFYQLYFLRKQCAVKVTCGGKWRECRYGSGVVSKGVISWMCLGCDPMEHDRKSRVGNVGTEILKGIKTGSLADKLKDLLLKIGEVVVQLGNAQEALEGKKKEAIAKVQEELRKAKTKLGELKNGGGGSGALKSLEDALTVNGNSRLMGKELLEKAKNALNALTTKGGSKGILGELIGGEGLGKAANGKGEVDPGKNKISASIKGVRKALEIMKDAMEKDGVKEIDGHQGALLTATKMLISLCNSPKCPGCNSHSNKCGKQGEKKTCDKCHQQYMDGFPSPLQAFLEDRLPGFSCDVVRNTDTDKDTVYPPAASHLDHCNGSGQCCPLPMGFRGQFQKGITHTGQRHHLASL